MVSTFRLPNSVLAGGNMALYTCPAGKSDGAYAQCDGGFCFTSTEAGPSFPGSDEPLAANQIICSCPITVADPDTASFGYQIAGPYPCEADFFKNCQSADTNKRTGTTIPVGAPTGSARNPDPPAGWPTGATDQPVPVAEAGWLTPTAGGRRWLKPARTSASRSEPLRARPAGRSTLPANDVGGSARGERSNEAVLGVRHHRAAAADQLGRRARGRRGQPLDGRGAGDAGGAARQRRRGRAGRRRPR